MASATETDARWMRLALGEAERGRGRTSPNPPVGCVLVRGGRELARGFHRRFGGPHAEIEALARAGPKARGATVYVTLEPCCHEGKTPPCTEALVASGVRRVVVGVRDPHPAVAGRGLRRLRRAGLRVELGVLREQCAALVEGFEAWVTEGVPKVHLKLAASLDGRIATRTGRSKWISSVPSRRLVHGLRASSDAVLVGVGTVLADDPRLTCRIKGGRNPLRVVLDRRLRTPPGARVLRAPGRCILVCMPSAPAARRRRVERTGAEVVAVDSRGRAGWRRVLRELGRRGVLELLIEGGSAVATSALRAGVVNEMTIFYNPRFIGDDGVPLLGRLGVEGPELALKATTTWWRSSGEDLVWNGRIR